MLASVARLFVVSGPMAALVACAGSDKKAPSVAKSTPVVETQPKQEATRQNGPQESSIPKIVTANRYFECVPYARAQAIVNMRGNAWTWWRGAKNRYDRSRTLQIGVVLVLKRGGKSLAHLAVVKRIVGPGEIIVDHTNWLNRGLIHLATPIRDVSRKKLVRSADLVDARQDSGAVDVSGRWVHLPQGAGRVGQWTGSSATPVI